MKEASLPRSPAVGDTHTTPHCSTLENKAPGIVHNVTAAHCHSHEARAAVPYNPGIFKGLESRNLKYTFKVASAAVLP